MAPTGRIFISYRREDAPHMAGRLADRLRTQMPGVEVFMDVETITPGDDFSASVTRAVAACRVLVAIIGPRWSTASDPQGRRRLHRADDWVRREISTALERGVRVIPVLVDYASMPDSEDLPEDLRRLASRNAIRIDHETFNTDINRLIDALTSSLHVKAAGWRAGPLPAPSPRAPRDGVHLGHASASETARLPLYRSAIRICLWWATFVIGVFSGAGLGLAFSRPPPSSAGVVGSIIAEGFLFALLVGALLLIRKEIQSERALMRRYRDRLGDSVVVPKALSRFRFRILLCALGVVVLALALAAWLSP